MLAYPQQLTLRDLASLMGFSERYIKYLVEKRILTPPNGNTRAARYAEIHVAELAAVKQLKAIGWTAKQIRQELTRLRQVPEDTPGLAQNQTLVEPTIERRYQLAPGVVLAFASAGPIYDEPAIADALARLLRTTEEPG